MIFSCAVRFSKNVLKIPDLSLPPCINLSQIFECRIWETEHYNPVLEITVLFLGIHKWEPVIYIGFSPALHLQCGSAFYL
jgi:hypothetical protein